MICQILEKKFSVENQVKYNNFADKRCVCCVRNFGDVISNIGFAIAWFVSLQHGFISLYTCVSGRCRIYIFSLEPYNVYIVLG